jgi:hypothetical protein
MTDNTKGKGILVAAIPVSQKLNGLDSSRVGPTFNTEWIRKEWQGFYWEVVRLDGDGKVDPKFRFRVRNDESGLPDTDVSWSGTVFPSRKLDNSLTSEDIQAMSTTQIKRLRKMFLAKDKVFPDGSNDITNAQFKDHEYIIFLYAVIYPTSTGPGLIDPTTTKTYSDMNSREFLSEEPAKSMLIANLGAPAGAKLVVATSVANHSDGGKRASGNFSTKMISDDYNNLFWSVMFHDGTRPDADYYFGVYSDKRARKDDDPFQQLIKSGDSTKIIRDRNLYIRSPQAPKDFTLFVFATK